MMKKVLILIFGSILLFSCEVQYVDYDCYVFEIRYEETYIPYRPMYYSINRYERCGLSEYNAYREALSNEYQVTTYDSLRNYYTTIRQTCSYWRVW